MVTCWVRPPAAESGHVSATSWTDGAPASVSVVVGVGVPFLVQPKHVAGGLTIGVAKDIPGVELAGVVEVVPVVELVPVAEALEVCSVLRVGLHPENATSNTAQNESAAKPPVSARRGLCTHAGTCGVVRMDDGGS